MVDRRNPSQIQAVIDRVEVIEQNLADNTQMTKAIGKDIHDLRNESQTRGLQMIVIEKNLASQTLAALELNKLLADTAIKAALAHQMTSEIRDLLRVGKFGVLLLKGAAAIAGAVITIGAAFHFWPKG